MQPVLPACPDVSPGVTLVELLRPLGIAPQTLYDDPQGIIAVAKKLKERGGQGFCLLPFCQTTEAAAMGANIRPASDTAGPRASGYVIDDISGVKTKTLAAHPSIQNLLSALSILSGEGEKVVYELCGPVSILSCMMDLAILFRQWRKEPETVFLAFDSIKAMLLELLKEICRAGAACVSYADPAANPEILGPKHSKWLSERFTAPFLEKAAEICGEYNVTLSVCPMTASALLGAGFLRPADGTDARLAVCCASTAKKIPVASHVISFKNEVEP